MAHATITACLLAALAAVAAADDVILNNGRTVSGTVTVQGDFVNVEMAHGSVQFPLGEIKQIQVKDTPESVLARKMTDASLNDPNALLELAQLAVKNDLPRYAETFYNRLLKLDPNNVPARRGLGYVCLDGQWRTFDQAVEYARNRLDAGQQAAVLSEVVPAMEEAASTRERRAALRELSADADLRAGKFAQAMALFQELADKATAPKAARFAAIADLLKENPDGMYVLAEAFPPAAELLGNPGPALKPGPAPLSDPLALQAALRDRAKKDIDAGAKAMDEAQAAEPTDPDAAKAKYAQAGKSFDHADALVQNISRSYRIELARRRISVLRKESDAEAKEFDKEMSSLGKKGLSPQAYQNKVLRLIYLLDNVRDDLKEVLEMTKPYSRDLLLEAKWAELDMKKIEEMRQVLTGELDGKK